MQAVYLELLSASQQPYHKPYHKPEEQQPNLICRSTKNNPKTQIMKNNMDSRTPRKQNKH